MSTESISLAEAAERLGVHYMTAYRYVRTGRLPARKQGAEWRVDPDDLAAMQADVGGRAAPGAGGGRRRRHDYHLRLRDRLLDGDEAGAWSIVESALAAGHGPDEVYLDLLSPALREIGDGWAAGEVSVAQEHRASVVTHRIIGRLGPRFTRRGRKRGTIVLGAAPGDRHGVPSALAADLLRSRSFDVVDLGADTPAASFVDAASRVDRLVGVGISVTGSAETAGVPEVVAALKDSLGCPVVLGGSGLAGSEEGRALGADVVTTTTAELLDAFEQLASSRSRTHHR